jgi:cell division protein FtsB
VREKRPGSLRKKIAAIGFAFFFLALIVTLFFGKKGLIEIYRARRVQAALLEEIERLRRVKTRLEKEIAELEKDPRAVDKPAREQLWLIGPDEKVIVRKDKNK